MAGNMRHQLAILMGLIIAVADVYWTYTSYFDTTWLALGVIIFIANAIWLYLEVA